MHWVRREGGGSYNIHSADDKKGYTPQKNIDKKGEHEVLSTARFSTYMWSLASIKRPCRMYGTLFFIYSPSPYQNRETLDGLWYIVKHSPLRNPNIRTGNISDLRTASVHFIHEPHNNLCILNRVRIQVIEACPVTTDCIM